MSSSVGAPVTTAPRAWYHIEHQSGLFKMAVGGDWTVRSIGQIDLKLRTIDCGNAEEFEIDGGSLDKLDSTGAWLLIRTKRMLENRGQRVRAFRIPPIFIPLAHTIEHEHLVPAIILPERHTFPAFLDRLGRSFIHAIRQAYEMLGYLGRVSVETAQTIVSPRRNLRFAALVHQTEEIGLNSLPIVGLLAFLIGIVLAYQGGDQLKRISPGAELFTVNLLGVGILRELGGLVTAIIIAGRSGSAFTAQIGTMRVNEEIDAMETIGLNTVDVLVLPRILGLMLALPLLTFFSDILGLTGGAIMCNLGLGISVPAFMRQLHQAISLNTFLVGVIKAPVFAFVIGLVGCYEGLQVERNAASVGKLTTRSVVESIFLIIVLDAGFSVMFSILGI